jgi:hypothetical protein
MTAQGTNSQETEMVINHIIADMAGLDLEEVTPEKKIADDLGLTKSRRPNAQHALLKSAAEVLFSTTKQ